MHTLEHQWPLMPIPVVVTVLGGVVSRLFGRAAPVAAERQLPPYIGTAIACGCSAPRRRPDVADLYRRLAIPTVPTAGGPPPCGTLLLVVTADAFELNRGEMLGAFLRCAQYCDVIVQSGGDVGPGAMTGPRGQDRR